MSVRCLFIQRMFIAMYVEGTFSRNSCRTFYTYLFSHIQNVNQNK